MEGIWREVPSYAPSTENPHKFYRVKFFAGHCPQFSCGGSFLGTVESGRMPPIAGSWTYTLDLNRGLLDLNPRPHLSSMRSPLGGAEMPPFLEASSDINPMPLDPGGASFPANSICRRAMTASCSRICGKSNQIMWNQIRSDQIGIFLILPLLLLPAFPVSQCPLPRGQGLGSLSLVWSA